MTEFPTNNIAPLIQFQGQVSVTSNPFRIVGIHHSFTSWANCNGHFKIRLSGFCYPSNLEIHEGSLPPSKVMSSSILSKISCLEVIFSMLKLSYSFLPLGQNLLYGPSPSVVQ